MIGLTLVSLALDRHRCNIQQYETKRLILNICLHFSFKDALVAINELHAAYFIEIRISKSRRLCFHIFIY